MLNAISWKHSLMIQCVIQYSSVLQKYTFISKKQEENAYTIEKTATSISF